MAEAKHSYIVSARKYRPATFASVVGQSSLAATLKNAIASDRLAQAYLFCGPRGVGKTSCARIFAKTINCEHRGPDGEACGKCESCKAIERGNSYNIIELDAASNNGVDNIRTLTEQVNVPPQTGRYRVFIIDEVHMLSTGAFNAFLKTLEEPPSYVIFILATTEKHKVIPTILSRCQIYDFKRITVADTVAHLKRVAQAEGITAEESALNVIARKADGAMRDALSIFDQVAASSQGNITYHSTIENLNVLDSDYYFKLVECFRTGDVQNALLQYKEITDRGFDSHFFINGLASHVRDLMVAADARTLDLLEAGEDLRAAYGKQAASLPMRWFYDALEILNTADLDFRAAANKQLLTELSLIRLCRLMLPAEQGLSKPFRPSVDISNAPKPATPQPTPAAPAAPLPQPKSQYPVQSGQQRDMPMPQQQASRPVVHRPTHTISISALTKEAVQATTLAADAGKESEKPAPEPEPAPKQAAAAPIEFGNDDLHKLWLEYAATCNERKILAAAMRNCLPELMPGNVAKLTVAHPAEKQVFEPELGDIVQFLRNKSGIASLAVDIELGEAQLRPEHKTDAQYLREVVARNGVIRDLLSTLEVELI